MDIKGITHLKRVIYRIYQTRYPNTPMDTRNISHVYGHYLSTVKASDKFIIPMAYYYPGFNFGVNDLAEGTFEKLVFPIVPGERQYTKRTADPLIGYLLYTRVLNMGTVLKCSITNGQTYYGGEGFILDSDYNPLVIFGAVCSGELSVLVRHSPISVINPVVFSRDDAVSKYIVKKLIPFMSDFDILGSFGTNYDEWKDTKMKTLITDEISKFVVSPSRPSGDYTKELWDIAEDSLPEILDNLL